MRAGRREPDGGCSDGRPRRWYVKENKRVEEAESRNNRFSVVVFLHLLYLGHVKSDFMFEIIQKRFGQILFDIKMIRTIKLY